MKLDASILKDFFLDSSLSDFFKEIDIFYIDFFSHTAQSCSTLRSLGYEDADLLKVMENFPVHESDRDRANLQLQRIWSGQIETFIDAFRLASKDGSSYRWLRFTVKVLLRNSEKRPKIVVGHVVDLDDLITSQEEIRERLVEIDTMRELFTAINKSLDFSETFSRTIDQLRRIIPFDRSCVESLEDGRLIAVAGYGYNESDLSGLVFPAHGVENPAVRAIEERRIVICNDVQQSFPGFINVADKFVTMSWLGIPLIYEKKVIGLLTLDNKELNAYTDQHVRIASELSDYIAIALEHARRHQLVTRQAMTDKLTGLANRYGLETHGIEIFQKAIEEEHSIGVLIIDIDHFKQINDTYGHSYGDVVLQTIALTIRGQIRTRDYAIRYGGEEFVVLLPELGTREALIVAERLRNKIAQIKMEDNKKMPTVSIGIYAAIPGTLDILHEFIRKADMALYAAKEAGRNRSRVWSISPEFYGEK